jgi:hypothetical protein
MEYVRSFFTTKPTNKDLSCPMIPMGYSSNNIDYHLFLKYKEQLTEIEKDYYQLPEQNEELYLRIERLKKMLYSI